MWSQNILMIKKKYFFYNKQNMKSKQSTKIDYSQQLSDIPQLQISIQQQMDSQQNMSQAVTHSRVKSQHHDKSRILVGDMRKFIKNQIIVTNQNFSKKTQRLSNNYPKLLKFLLRIASQNVSYQVLKLVTISRYGLVFLQRSKKTKISKIQTKAIWDAFIQIYQKYGQDQIQKQRKIMRDCIQKYASNLLVGRTPGNQKRKNAYTQNDLKIFDKIHQKMMFQIKQNSIRQHHLYQARKHMGQYYFMMQDRKQRQKKRQRQNAAKTARKDKKTQGRKMKQNQTTSPSDTQKTDKKDVADSAQSRNYDRLYQNHSYQRSSMRGQPQKIDLNIFSSQQQQKWQSFINELQDNQYCQNQ